MKVNGRHIALSLCLAIFPPFAGCHTRRSPVRTSYNETDAPTTEARGAESVRWTDKDIVAFSSIREGMSDKDVRGLLGAPTERRAWTPPLFWEKRMASNILVHGTADPERSLPENKHPEHEVWIYVNPEKSPLQVDFGEKGTIKLQVQVRYLIYMDDRRVVHVKRTVGQHAGPDVVPRVP